MTYKHGVRGLAGIGQNIKRLIEISRLKSFDRKYTEPYMRSIAMTTIAVLALLFSIPFLTTDRSGQLSNKLHTNNTQQTEPIETLPINAAHSNSINLQAGDISAYNQEESKELTENNGVIPSHVDSVIKDSNAIQQQPLQMDPGEILMLANKEIKAQRITSLQGKNAWERYRMLMLGEPGNPAAQQGLRTLFVKQIELAKQAEARGQSQLVMEYLAMAEKILFGVSLPLKSMTTENSRPNIDALTNSQASGMPPTFHWHK